MSKAKVLPFTGNWHLELASENAPDAKARKALRDAETKEAGRMYQRPQKISAAPAVGWSDPREELLTVADLAKHFRVTPGAIYKAVREGKLIAETFGNQIRFSRAEIDAYKTRQAQKRHG